MKIKKEYFEYLINLSKCTAKDAGGELGELLLEEIENMHLETLKMNERKTIKQRWKAFWMKSWLNSVTHNCKNHLKDIDDVNFPFEKYCTKCGNPY